MKQKLYVLTCALLSNFIAFGQKHPVSTFAGSGTQGSTDGSIHLSGFKIFSKLFESIRFCK
uniref:hypothetical protein n=1 Tax=Flavobacterium sp. TaxID=239 RepID=UPI00404B6A82